MLLNIKIARRYLFGKKSTNAINYITWISILGIAIGTAALILILSVFNGFQGVISDMNSSFTPDLKVTPKEGKYFTLDSTQVTEIDGIKGVSVWSETIEEISIMDYKNVQKPARIKGVDDRYGEVSEIDSAITRGQFVTSFEGISYGVIGRVLNSNLSVNASDNLTPITVFMKLRKSGGILGSMGKTFKSMQVYPSGVFSVGGETDAQYLLTNKAFVEKLLDREGQNTALEIKLTEGASEKTVRKELKTILGDGFAIKNEYEQDESFLRIMNIEKWISFLITTMVLLIIAFNMVGTLWMMVLEKKKDISILRSMGYGTPDVRGIFIWQGLLITGIGIAMGIILALILYFLQKEYGLIGVPVSLAIDAYPIELRGQDFIVIILTVISIGFLASLLPAFRASQVTANVRSE